jgi:hypothetical protein
MYHHTLLSYIKIKRKIKYIVQLKENYTDDKDWSLLYDPEKVIWPLLTSWSFTSFYDFTFFFFGTTGVWTQGFKFAKQVFYCLHYASSSFRDRAHFLTWTFFLLFYAACYSWDDRHRPPCEVLYGSHKLLSFLSFLFFFFLARNHILQISAF